MTSDITRISLAEMRDGQQGTVDEIACGAGLLEKLTSMGIRPGKRITRFCSMFMKGPVTVRIDNVQLALGRGIASKVLVIPDKAGDENPACR